IRAVCLSSSRRSLCSTGTEDYPFLGAAVPPQSDTDGQSASLPSVTTVLDRTRPPESAIALARWLRKKQEALGPEGFARYRAGLLSAGTQLHRSIWSYLESGDAQPEAEVAGFFQSVLPILRTVESVQSQEALVVHQQLGYKGRLDCLARLRPDEGDVNSGRQRPELLIEWKTAHERKIAGLKDAYDAPLQLASYLGALNQMRRCCHGNEDSLPPVDSAILVYAYPDGSPAACLRLGVDQLLPAWSAWLHRLRAFQLAQDRAAAKLTR
ncbi:hypothetical protein BOX15_Mlig003194g3, partial [Macrostomum lignano]